MYEQYTPHHDHSPYHIEPLQTEQAPEQHQGVTEAASQEGREADPYEVIDFLLKKAEDQQTRLNDHEAFITLQNQEIDALKGQLESARQELEAKKQELERQLSDYDVLMQNTLAVEHELEQLKVKSGERPKIMLPFYTEQKLQQLGYGEATSAVEERQAV